MQAWHECTQAPLFRKTTQSATLAVTLARLRGQQNESSRNDILLWLNHASHQPNTPGPLCTRPNRRMKTRMKTRMNKKKSTSRAHLSHARIRARICAGFHARIRAGFHAFFFTQDFAQICSHKIPEPYPLGPPPIPATLVNKLNMFATNHHVENGLLIW